MGGRSTAKERLDIEEGCVVNVRYGGGRYGRLDAWHRGYMANKQERNALSRPNGCSFPDRWVA